MSIELSKDQLQSEMEQHTIQPRAEIPNTQWQYLIIYGNDCSIVGTNDIRVAKEFANSEDYAVIHVSTCQFMETITPGSEGGDLVTEYHNIPEQSAYEF